MRSVLITLLAAGCLCAQEPGPQVDALFSRFAGKQPGCAVGVVREGKTVLAKAYGMADLEHDIAITPDSTFYMASVSKQFTAMSILLLAEDNRIRAEGGGLSVEVGDRAPVHLQSLGPDRMHLANGGAELLFRRDNGGAVTGFYLNPGRVRHVEFERVDEHAARYH